MIKIKTKDLTGYFKSESDSAEIEVKAYSIGRTFDGHIVLTVRDAGKYCGAFLEADKIEVANNGEMFIN